MGTSIETMWVSSPDQLNATVTTLVAQGGQVQNQAEDEVVVFLKKKLNIVVLIVGLLLCGVPGIAYLIWYSTADQSQQITVKIGSPANINTQHSHWYDQPAIDGASPGTVPPPIAEAPATTPIADAPAAPAIDPPAPAIDPSAPPAVDTSGAAQVPPAAPTPPVADVPPAPPTPPTP